MLLPEIKMKFFQFSSKLHLTDVPLIEVDTEDNGLTR
jgi:hypothetical protein